MVSSGTSSVPAYNAYLEGLAANTSTLSTADVYTFLGARDAYERAIELDPEFSFAYWELAQFWEVQAQTTNIVAGIVDMPNEQMVAEFEDSIEKAIRYERDPVNRLAFRVLQAKEDLQLAEALRLKPDFTEAHFNLGTILARQNRPNEAIYHYTEALRIKPGYVEAHNNLGTVLAREGELDEAIGHFKEALRLRPEFAQAHYNLGNAFLGQGNIKGAMHHFSETLLLRPDHRKARKKLEALVRTASKGNETSNRKEGN